MPALPPDLSDLRGVKVRTKPASRRLEGKREAKIRSSPVYAGHTIKPLKKLDISSQSACSLGQDRGYPARPENPCPHPPKAMSFLIPFRATLADAPKRNDLPSNSDFGMRAQTCQRQPARPEAAV